MELEVLPNEKFTGKGHDAHICKRCAKKPLEERNEEITLTCIGRVYRYSNLSQQNMLMLEKYSHSNSERVRQAAVDTLSSYSGCFATNETGN
jgi:hypothetical protein